MNKSALFACLLCCVMRVAPARAQIDELPLVGLDKDNKPVQVMIDKSDYQKRISQSLNSVQAAALPALTQQKPGSWALNTFLVGVGLNFDVGIAGLFHVGALPRFRVLFTDVENPPIP